MSRNHLRHFGEFHTGYLLWDAFNPPFDSLDVRKALAKAINRERSTRNPQGLRNR